MSTRSQTIDYFRMSQINVTKYTFISSYQYRSIIKIARCIYANLVDAAGVVGNHLV